MPLEESTPAIVLRARDYAESDRIVTLLTLQRGQAQRNREGRQGVAPSLRAQARTVFARRPALSTPAPRAVGVYHARRSGRPDAARARRRPREDRARQLHARTHRRADDRGERSGRGVSRAVGRTRRAQHAIRGRGAAPGFRDAAAGMGGLRTRVHALPHMRDASTATMARRFISSCRAAGSCARNAGRRWRRARSSCRAGAPRSSRDWAGCRWTIRPARRRRDRTAHSRWRGSSDRSSIGGCAARNFSIQFCRARAKV